MREGGYGGPLPAPALGAVGRGCRAVSGDRAGLSPGDGASLGMGSALGTEQGLGHGYCPRLVTSPSVAGAVMGEAHRDKGSEQQDVTRTL